MPSSLHQLQFWTLFQGDASLPVHCGQLPAHTVLLPDKALTPVPPAWPALCLVGVGGKRGGEGVTWCCHELVCLTLRCSRGGKRAEYSSWDAFKYTLKAHVAGHLSPEISHLPSGCPVDGPCPPESLPLWLVTWPKRPLWVSLHGLLRSTENTLWTHL